MDRLILIDSREAYNTNEIDAHEARLEYEQWLMATDPMDAWIESMESNPQDSFDDTLFEAIR